MQKDAQITLHKENIALLKEELDKFKSQHPDVLAQCLSDRVKLLEEQLHRLMNDASSTQEQIKAKERELGQALMKCDELTKRHVDELELLTEFLCPRCGAPMTERSQYTEEVEHQGRTVEVTHQLQMFECGYTLVDGEPSHPCNRTNARTE